MQYVSQYRMEAEMFEKTKPLTCTLFSEKQLSHLSPFDVRALLTHESGIYCVTAGPSNILHLGTGMRCFANQDFAEREPARLYYVYFGLHKYGKSSGGETGWGGAIMAGA